MLSTLLAHQGQPVAPHDLWMAWNPDVTVIVGLVGAAWAYRSGCVAQRRPARDRRSLAFWLGLGTVGVALVTPLDAMAGALASAHMVQHVLLLVLAAPLLAFGEPVETIMRGSPLGVRKIGGRWRRRAGLTPARLRWTRHPGGAWLIHAGAVWFWHASVPYGLALDHEPVHFLEHASFLLAALWFWSVVVRSGRISGVSPGLGVLLVFTIAMQGVLLAALMTFATTPWYPGYADSTSLWGMSALTDQQLAGVLMWVPAGLVYTAAALLLLTAWIRESEPHPSRSGSPPH